MAVLYGWQRKLNLLPLSLVVLGWVVFSIGFIWELVDWPKDDGSEIVYIPRTSPLLFSQYLLLVGGPFVYLLGVAQAILPGIASSIVGIPTAFVSSTYLVAAGYHAYFGALYIKTVVENDGVTLDTKEVLMFAGALFVAVCWCFVLMLSVSHKSKPKRNQIGYDIFDQRHGQSRQKCRAPFTPGVARVLSIPFILLSLAGWCVYTVGIERLKTDEYRHIIDLSVAPLAKYGAVVVGPLLYLSSLLHAGCSGGASKVMGVFTSILSTVYTVFIGFLVIFFGKSIYSLCQLESKLNKPNCSIDHSSLNINLIYIFAGGVGSIFLWTIVLALQPFYRDHSQGGHGDNIINSSQPQYGTMSMEESFNNSYSSQPLITESGKR